MASLDGFSVLTNRVLELKCPLNARPVTEIPDNYLGQVVAQVIASGADGALYAEYHGGRVTGTVLLTRAHAMTLWEGHYWPLIEPHLKFLDSRIDLEQGEGDVVTRTDALFEGRARAYLAADADLKAAQEALEIVRKELLEVCGPYSSAGAGVQVTRFEQQGSVDWKAALKALAPEAEQSVVDKFRGKSKVVTRITVAKGGE
jgi:hypothetical protein